MSNNLFTFSISKYVAENNMNIFDSSPFSDADSFIDNRDDLSYGLEPYEQEQNQDFIFDSVNKIMNQEQNLDENEKAEEQGLYFLNKEEKKEPSFLGQKRNINESNPEEVKEIKDPKETKPSTGELSHSKKITKKIFNSNQKLYRNDYYIKKFKVECFSNYAKDKLNDLLKACKFPKDLNITKIYMPNNKAFTSIANLKKNKEFLNKEIKVIFSTEKGNGQNQIKNGINFTTIFNSKNKAANIQAYENLINFLNKTVEDVIIEFYSSEEFKKFCSDKEIQEYDEGFFKEKKFRILKDLGFLKLIKGEY